MGTRRTHGLPALGLAIFTLLSGMASVAVQAQVPCSSPLGIAESVEGSVTVRRADAPQLRRLEQGDVLCADDRIQVDALSRAALSLDHFGVLRIDQKSIIQLPSPPATGVRALFELIRGAALFFSSDP